MPSLPQTAAAPSVPPSEMATTPAPSSIFPVRAIPDAEVVITATDGCTITLRTDADGNFNAGTIASRLRISSQGFEPVDLPVSGPDRCRSCCAR